MMGVKVAMRSPYSQKISSGVRFLLWAAFLVLVVVCIERRFMPSRSVTQAGKTVTLSRHATVDFSDFSVSVSEGGTLTIGDVFYGDGAISPLQIFSAALKKYPKTNRLILLWKTAWGSSWSSNKVVYNRGKKVLIFRSESGMGDASSSGKRQLTYTHVTEGVVLRASALPRHGQSDGEFNNLRRIKGVGFVKS